VLLEDVFLGGHYLAHVCDHTFLDLHVDLQFYVLQLQDVVLDYYF